ncbi:hypothetical protein ACIGKQ_11240 [Gordonia sp. NPDC062954]|uniref:hypothetical protein n=1 Tax=Gordonia sp. NPDC062954 TaxID=3364003 RepID=UPI0037C8DACC
MTAGAAPGPARRPGAHLGRRGRRRVIVATAIAFVAVVVTVVGLIGAARSRPVPDDTQRTAVLTATDAAVTALLSYTPDETERDRHEVLAQLTAPIDEAYRAQGVDVVLPGAIEAGMTLSAQVVGAGVEEFTAERAWVLVFVDQTVSIPAATDTGDRDDDRTPTARWATMRNVEGNWRLADLAMVGDVTR